VYENTFFLREFSNKKKSPKNPETLFPMRYYCHVFGISPKNKPRCARFLEAALRADLMNELIHQSIRG